MKWFCPRAGGADMCGIAGYLDCTRRTAPAEAVATVEAMCAALRHRGPDAGGTWIDKECGLALGHRRLSVIDLSMAGHQPMTSSCGRYIIIFNGEIYNFQELRQALEQQRAVSAGGWRGHSDTEVLLAAIVHWGLELTLAKLNGMFAFAVWDRSCQRLHLVRDRMGEKPLYYGFSNGVFLFASELKALKACRQSRLELNRDAVALLLRHNYIPAPYSIFQQIHKLPAANHFSITLLELESGQLPLPRRYWRLNEVAESGLRTPLRGSESDILAETETLLADAVRLRLNADVAVGAFLSGGIDSSLIVALMQEQSSRPVKTFSIGFHEPGYDEAGYARKVAAHLGTDHSEYYIRPEEALAVIPELPTLYDEPFSDSSQIPTYLVSKLARRKVTVSLSGDGGDELFCGYSRYQVCDRIWRNLSLVPLPLRKFLPGLLSRLPLPALKKLEAGLLNKFSLSRRPRTLLDRLSVASDVVASASVGHLYHRMVSHWKDPVSLIYGAKELPTVLTDSIFCLNTDDSLSQMMYWDTLSYLPDDILVKVDRATMGVGLEARVPFLDHRVVELAWRIPLSLKFRGGEGKWLLRRLLSRHVPPDLTQRPKMGFGVPIDSWLRGPLREWAAELLEPSRLKREGIFVPEPITEKWAEHLSGQRNWHYYLWDVLMFQAWWEQQ